MARYSVLVFRSSEMRRYSASRACSIFILSSSLTPIMGYAYSARPTGGSLPNLSSYFSSHISDISSTESR